MSSPSLVPLSRLPIGAAATVASVAPPAGGENADLMLRLIEIGFLPGESVRVIARGQPGDEPLAVRIGRSTFALRRFEAAFVQVELQTQAQATAQPTSAPPSVRAADIAGADQRRAHGAAAPLVARPQPQAARP